MPDITTTSSKVVYKNPWIEIREDQITYPDGTPGIYGVLHRPDFSLIIPMTDTGFYLVEQYRYPLKARHWEFPQGSWEHNPDADPAELARGELAEETGLRAGHLKKLGTVHEAAGLTAQRGHIYLATDLTPGPTNLSPEEAGLICEHIPYAQFPELLAAGRITDGSTLAAYTLLMLDRGITFTEGE